MNKSRRAFSLLEIILALAIFAIAVAAIGELVRLGLRNAQFARDTTRAQLLCESIVAELTSQATTLEPIVDRPSEIDPDWRYSVEVAPADVAGLVSVAVTVSRANPTSQTIPTSSTDGFTLVRWMPDPQYVAEMQATTN